MCGKRDLSERDQNGSYVCTNVHPTQCPCVSFAVGDFTLCIGQRTLLHLALPPCTDL